jgi:hypothetical protein
VKVEEEEEDEEEGSIKVDTIIEHTHDNSECTGPFLHKKLG